MQARLTMGVLNLKSCPSPVAFLGLIIPQNLCFAAEAKEKWAPRRLCQGTRGRACRLKDDSYDNLSL